MPAENVRLVVQGVPRADKDFDLVEVNRSEAQRLAQLMEKDAAAAQREIERIVRGAGSNRIVRR